MRPLSSIFLGGAVIVLFSGLVSVHAARATEQDAAKIPPTDLGCTLCHSGPSATVDFIPPGGSESLTSFGRQWLSLGVAPGDRLWSEMAGLNADTDGCSNGYEMGDPDGDYPAGATPKPRFLDPSEQDCILPLDEQSWGNLKSLFES